jgi:hypothetical protein
MITPWDQIKSFKETYNFEVRHSALMAVGFVNVFKIIETDYEKRTTAMAKIWGAQFDYTWAPEMGQLAQFEESFDVPPFIKDGIYGAAAYADQGDEMVLMPGCIMYASNDCVEKEIHQCQWDIVGAEVEAVKRNELHRFGVLPERRVVERTLGRLEKIRRLWKNRERKIHTTPQMMVLALISLLLKRY